MTNAEKVAKDTDVIIELLLRYSCNCIRCKDCIISKKLGMCFKFQDINSIKSWLESETDEK